MTNMNKDTKNVSLRVAAIILVCVLLTTCLLSGTFAKYISKSDTSDSARVAKWGIITQAEGTLFGKTAKNGGYTSENSNLTVKSTNDNVIAPGVSSSTLTLSVKGTPEVAGKVTATVIATDTKLPGGTWGIMVPVTLASGTSLNGYYSYDSTNGKFVAKTTADGTLSDGDTDTYYELQNYVKLYENYTPIVWYIDGESGSKSALQLKTYLEGTNGLQENPYTLGQTLVIEKKISCKWTGSNDNADTILGQLAASSKGDGTI